MTLIVECVFPACTTVVIVYFAPFSNNSFSRAYYYNFFFLGSCTFSRERVLIMKRDAPGEIKILELTSIRFIKFHVYVRERKSRRQRSIASLLFDVSIAHTVLPCVCMHGLG